MSSTQRERIGAEIAERKGWGEVAIRQRGPRSAVGVVSQSGAVCRPGLTCWCSAVTSIDQIY